MYIDKIFHKGEYRNMKNRLAEWREKRKLTQEQLAELAGITRMHIYRLENSKTPLSDKNKEKFAGIFGCHPEDLSPFRGIVINQAPLISWVQAGSFTECFDPYQQGDYAELVTTTHDAPTIIALKVVGNSMDKFAPDGATIIIDYADKELVDGWLYVVRFNGNNETTFKRYRANPPRLEPYSRGEYETIYPTGDIDVVGRVVEAMIQAPGRK